MKNISFDYLFESDIAKIVQKEGTSNSIKIETFPTYFAIIFTHVGKNS